MLVLPRLDGQPGDLTVEFALDQLQTEDLNMGSFERIAAGCLFLTATVAHAQPLYPEKPVRLVVPFPVGTGTDITARVVGQRLSELWSRPVVVDNIPGAAGSVAAERAAKAAPDGYTLLFSGDAAMTTNVTLYPKLAYDPLRDFAPVMNFIETPNILVVHPSLPVKNVKELIALARARPGEISYASSGSGTSQHLGGALLSSMAKIDMVHVPYKAPAQIVQDIIGGRIAIWFGNTLTVMPLVRTNRLRGIAVSSSRRLSAAQELPTVAETGLPGFHAVAWFGLLAPSATPGPILAKLHQDSVRVINTPEVRTRFVENGAEIVGNSPAEFAAQIKAEIAAKGQLVRASGAKAD